MRILFTAIALILIINCQGQNSNTPQLKELKKRIDDRTYPNIDGIIVEHCDEIIVEEYFNEFDKNRRHDMRSSFKSVTSLLAGIAVDKKLITIDDKLIKYFPELKDSDKGNITIQDLLEMRSGLNCEEFYDIGPDCENAMWNTDDWIAYCLNIKLQGKPGLNWSYSSNDPMLMGEVISRASGMTIMEFAKQNLFKPLNIGDYKWTITPKGRGMTAGSFYMKPTDMLKIAKLVFNNGNWYGKQIVSQEWIKKSTNCEIEIDFSFTRYSRMSNAKYSSAKYGFYWYRENLKYNEVNTEVLFASGNGGNYLMVLPEFNTKVVFTGSNYGNWRGKLPFEILLKYIIPMIENKNCR
jgi:Beta-lactamase class C and other penicillin binding proteins